MPWIGRRATGWPWPWGELYLRERERDGRPTHTMLDLDGTDDPTHGQLEGSAYHGYYSQHMYHPLLVISWALSPESRDFPR